MTEPRLPRLDLFRKFLARRCCFIKKDERPPHFPRPQSAHGMHCRSKCPRRPWRSSGVCKSSTLKVVSGLGHNKEQYRAVETERRLKAETECCAELCWMNAEMCECSGCWRSFRSRTYFNRKLAKNSIFMWCISEWITRKVIKGNVPPSRFYNW